MNKNWWESKTIWGALIAVVASILTIFGYDISQDDQEQLSVAITSIIAAIGGVIAIIGRVKVKDQKTIDSAETIKVQQKE